ncbi:hypothetical protein [Geodermatophilus sabuli]|uniref:Uncharacterized protein n=1 Tax=Geodermatophilus sabuli TaxID=1564158 RepID=A0A285EED4_9ACTN|nr:hypothetical protein [Geodermatophilus sabuli]MBB3084468.1 hypothetical protein [Geodermatophilus sabuli]SNX97337.1 hypothetical protein SAMN06893097_106287 [Geodermatophilus sabuli]
MTASAPPLDDLALLDRHITEAFTDLRATRAVAARTGNRQNQDSTTRAEEHLNALLEYRHAAVRRQALDHLVGDPRPRPIGP